MQKMRLMILVGTALTSSLSQAGVTNISDLARVVPGAACELRHGTKI